MGRGSPTLLIGSGSHTYLLHTGSQCNKPLSHNVPVELVLKLCGTACVKPHVFAVILDWLLCYCRCTCMSFLSCFSFNVHYSRTGSCNIYTWWPFSPQLVHVYAYFDLYISIETVCFSLYCFKLRCDTCSVHTSCPSYSINCSVFYGDLFFVYVLLSKCTCMKFSVAFWALSIDPSIWTSDLWLWGRLRQNINFFFFLKMYYM